MIKICFAIGNEDIESWIMQELKKRGVEVEYTKPATYRAAVFERVSREMPDVLVLSESLQQGGGNLSFDSIIKTIKTKFLSCRVVVITEEHEIGDEFLNRLVSRGVYDIVLGPNCNMNDVVDCILSPKPYSYAEELQGLDDRDSQSTPQKTQNVKPVPAKPSTPVQPTFPKTPAPAVSQPVYTEQSYVESGTSILRGEPRGIIFNKENDSVIKSDRVLTSSDNFFIHNDIVPQNAFQPKVIVYASARQGVGCTTVMLNSAYTLAKKGKKVVIIDNVYNDKSVFDRLRKEHKAFGFLSSNGNVPNFFQSALYMPFETEQTQGGIQILETVDGIEKDSGFISLIKSLSGVDYIFIDLSLAYFDDLLLGLVGLSDKIVAVCSQDGYEMLVLRNALNFYESKGISIYNRLVIVANKSNPRLSPTMSEISGYFNCQNVVMIPSDNNGFTISSSAGAFYLEKGKKKIREIYSFICTKYLGG